MTHQIKHRRISKKGKPFVAGSRKGPLLMMAQSGPEFLKAKGWVTERKFDGFRAAIVKEGSVVRIFGRSRKEYTQNFPEIVREVKTLRVNKVILDSEITYLDKRGNDQFSPIQRRVGIKDPIRMGEYIKKYPVLAFIFDILSIDGKNVMGKELNYRRGLLTNLFRSRQFIYLRLTDWYIESGRANVLSEQRRLGREGVMHKNPSGVYQPGVRSPDWRKHKFTADEDVIIIGYEPGDGKYKGLLGALYTAMLKDGRLFYTGKIGTGYSDDERKSLKVLLDKYRILTPKRDDIIQLYDKIGAAEVNRGVWVKPHIVAMIKYFEFSKDKRFRHGVFTRLRPDKTPNEVNLP